MKSTCFLGIKAPPGIELYFVKMSVRLGGRGWDSSMELLRYSSSSMISIMWEKCEVSSEKDSDFVLRLMCLTSIKKFCRCRVPLNTSCVFQISISSWLEGFLAIQS